MKKLFFLFFTLFLFSFIGCDSEANLKLISNDLIEISFSSKCSSTFEKIIRNFTGTSESVNLFNEEAISNGFTASGFQNVQVSTPDTISIKINFNENGNSSFTNSGLIKHENKSFKITFSKEILLNLYNSSDDELKTYLDLLVAPVFNDEIMSEEEYLELIGSIYGENCIPEIKESYIKINITDLDGKTTSSKISLLKLLTLSETICFN